ISNPGKFSLEGKDPLTEIKTANLKANHNKFILDFIEKDSQLLKEFLEGTECEQLNEAYSRYKKSDLKKLFALFEKIKDACQFQKESSKVTKKPRAKKPISKEKLISKLKFMKEHAEYSIVSESPENILGAKEVWVFNTKTRK